MLDLGLQGQPLQDPLQSVALSAATIKGTSILQRPRDSILSAEPTWSRDDQPSRLFEPFNDDTFRARQRRREVVLVAREGFPVGER